MCQRGLRSDPEFLCAESPCRKPLLEQRWCYTFLSHNKYNHPVPLSGLMTNKLFHFALTLKPVGHKTRQGLERVIVVGGLEHQQGRNGLYVLLINESDTHKFLIEK